MRYLRDEMCRLNLLCALTGRSGFDSRRRLGIFPSHHRVQNGSDAYPASYPSVTWSKAAGARS